MLLRLPITPRQLRDCLQTWIPSGTSVPCALRCASQNGRLQTHLSHVRLSQPTCEVSSASGTGYGIAAELTVSEGATVQICACLERGSVVLTPTATYPEHGPCEWQRQRRAGWVGGCVCGGGVREHTDCELVDCAFKKNKIYLCTQAEMWRKTRSSRYRTLGTTRQICACRSACAVLATANGETNAMICAVHV